MSRRGRAKGAVVDSWAAHPFRIADYAREARAEHGPDVSIQVFHRSVRADGLVFPIDVCIVRAPLGADAGAPLDEVPRG